ncbi:MAG: hypothetical protein P8Q95_02425 [Candidatus Poseidoniaceae archaeon]|nr:hypothetical protein [Candidatus Poseidoniaceae archaeon]
MPGVTIDCESDPELNVHPAYTEPVELICTITNTSSLEETIEISNEFEGGTMVKIEGASDEYTLASGEEEEFTITFTGDEKIPSSESFEFEINATVTKMQGVNLLGPLQSSAIATGKVEIETYGIVVLEIGDRSTRVMEPSDEKTIVFQFWNYGNDEDTIRVEVKNKANLETLGFIFPQSYFVADKLIIDGSSNRNIVIMAPSDVSEKISTNIQFEASSTNDPDAPVSAISIPVTVESSSSSSTLTGLSEDSQDDLILYGAIGGGVILFFMLVGIITRSIKNKSGPKSEGTEQAIEISDEDEGENFVDDLDDLFDDLDDFDDKVSSEDEFDDLLDDFE